MQMLATPPEIQESNEDTEPQEEDYAAPVYSGKLRTNKSTPTKVQTSRRRALINHY